MDGATIGWIGGIAGAATGLAGGVVGTRASLKQARTPAERRLTVRVAVGLWLAVAGLGAVLVLGLTGMMPYRLSAVVMCVFFVGLGPAIAWANRRQREAARRDRDAADASS